MKKIRTKSNNKPIILVNLILIAVLAVIAVYAWFAVNADNKVKMYDIEVHSNNPLELSFDNTNWGPDLNLADYQATVNGSTVNVLETMRFIEVTGDGSSFRIPTLTQYTGYALPNTSATWSDAVANQDYLDFPVYMRSKEPLKVYFSSESKAEPASAIDIGENCGNKSTYGDFSKDCIVGALRLAAYNGSTRKFLWITNPEYHLKNAKGSSDYVMEKGTYTQITGRFDWDSPTTHYYYNASKTLINTGDNIFSGTGLPNSVSGVPSSTATLLATLNGTPNASGYYTGSATFRVWIEGCDTEARRALVGGKFNLTIMLDSFEITS